MAGNLSIDGLISGLDTTDLINQLMEVERIPITQLEARKAGYNQKISSGRQPIPNSWLFLPQQVV